MLKCVICQSERESSECIRLSCDHLICWKCADNYLTENLVPIIKCPVESCFECFQDSEIEKIEMTRVYSLSEQIQSDNVREMLSALEDLDEVPNNQAFECSICNGAICKGKGVRLRNCSHNICRSCLSRHILEFVKIPVRCPESGCEQAIQDQEIQSILDSSELKLYLEKYTNIIKSRLINRVNCQTEDCDAFYDCSYKPETFMCRKCKRINCAKCCTIHKSETCEQYQTNKNNISQKAIEDKIKEKKLMRCPGCQNLIEKSGGCNWIQCSNCSMELCWILQMPRWGPMGHGDKSGGCRCGVLNNCHPDCGGCIPDNSTGIPSPRSPPENNNICSVM